MTAASMSESSDNEQMDTSVNSPASNNDNNVVTTPSNIDEVIHELEERIDDFAKECTPNSQQVDNEKDMSLDKRITALKHLLTSLMEMLRNYTSKQRDDEDSLIQQNEYIKGERNYMKWLYLNERKRNATTSPTQNTADKRASLSNLDDSVINKIANAIISRVDASESINSRIGNTPQNELWSLFNVIVNEKLTKKDLRRVIAIIELLRNNQQFSADLMQYFDSQQEQHTTSTSAGLTVDDIDNIKRLLNEIDQRESELEKTFVKMPFIVTLIEKMKKEITLLRSITVNSKRRRKSPNDSSDANVVENRTDKRRRVESAVSENDRALSEDNGSKSDDDATSV